MLNKRLGVSILIMAVFLMIISSFISALTPEEMQQQFDDESTRMQEDFKQGAQDMTTAGAVGVAGIGILFIIGIILGIISIVAFIWALLDILKSDKETSWKILWVIVCLFGILGVIIYLLVGRKGKNNLDKKN